jgi:hypothetical protein
MMQEGSSILTIRSTAAFPFIEEGAMAWLFIAEYVQELGLGLALA